MEVRNEKLLTVRECAERLNISRATLTRLIAKGAIAYYRVGLKIMFTEAHISEYLKSVESPRTMNPLQECAG